MTAGNSIKLGDTVKLDGIEYVWERVDRGREAHLLQAGTDDGWIVISMPELLRSAGPAKRASTVDLRPTSGDWPRDVLDMERHLLEAFTGKPMDDTAGGSRPQYDPTTTDQEARIQAKVAELAGTSLGRSRSVLFKYWAAYRKDGIAGINARMHRIGKPRLAIANADPRLIDVIDRVLDDRVNMPTASRRQCAALVLRQLRERFPEDEVCDIKSTTLQYYINERAAGRYSFAKATTRRTAANQPKRTYRSGASFRLGARVEIDSTVMDIQVRDDNGASYRPSLTMMYDPSCCVPVAWAIHAESPNGYDHSLLLARAVIGREDIPGWGATQMAAAAVLPDELVEQLRAAECDSSTLPWVFPQCITIDGGMDFRSAAFESGCRAYGIDIDLAPPRTPTVKPHIERFFGAVSTEFTTWLAGSTGNSVANRGSHDDPVWDIAGLRAMFQVWVTTVYIHTQREGLRDPLFAGRKWTPAQMYAALFEVGPGVPLPYDAEEFYKLMPCEYRVIDRDGIHFRNRIYDSDLLAGLRERKQAGRHDRKWEFRYDPYNEDAVWIRHPTTEEWIECLDRALIDALAPMASEVSMRLADGFAAPTQNPQENQRRWLDEVETRQRKLRKAHGRRSRADAASVNDRSDGLELEASISPVDLKRTNSEPAADSLTFDWSDPRFNAAEPGPI